MTKRLSDQYQPGDPVEIQFAGDERWWRGRVVRHAPPAVWVQTSNGQLWFVTNTRRIRKVKEMGGED
ncbi:MAG: hypothetical protein IPL78_13470 [Chloroflexi bacterium]|nr:hypothetical protein [Chloroflexota bacterium]